MFNHKELLKVVADLTCLFIFAIPLWVYNLLNVVPLTHVGFYCSDNSIRYPYRQNTVSSAVMMGTGFGVMLLMSIIVETWLYQKYRKDERKSMFHPLLVEIYRAMGYFVIGAAMNQFITDVGKQVVGRLRPHFFDLCLPNVNCTPDNEHLYMENYECQRTHHPLIADDLLKERLENARKSFPSGHASFSIFTALFIVVYLEYRMRSRNTRILRHLIQLGLLAWGFWISCTRIIDHKHRYSDVAAGMLLGALMASFAVYLYIRSSCSESRREMHSDVESNRDMREANTANG